MMLMDGRPRRCPAAKSLGSCAGVILTAPVPNSRSTKVSATTGISRPSTGSTTVRPTRWRWRSSSGCTATAVSPSSVSGRVVATTIPGPPPGSRIADVPEAPVDGARLHLEVAERGHAARAPVDDVVAAVDEALLVEGDEDLAHGARQPGVHREALAAPVEREAHQPELLQDLAAALLLPLPDALLELLAAEVLLLLALLRELALHHHLGGDARVVEARAARGRRTRSCASSARSRPAGCW